MVIAWMTTTLQVCAVLASSSVATSGGRWESYLAKITIVWMMMEMPSHVASFSSRFEKWTYTKMHLRAVHIYAYIYMYTCIHVYIHAHIHTCTHTYIHTCIHTYMHAHAVLRPRGRQVGIMELG